jgi:hypothetical protein
MDSRIAALTNVKPLTSSGHKKLDQRATGKRAWKSWARAQELQSINLSAAQFRKLIEALGGHPPPDNSASWTNPIAAYG